MRDYVNRNEKSLAGATSELDQAASLEEESDLGEEQAPMFAPLSRSKPPPQTLVVLPMVEGDQMHIFTQAVNRRLKQKAPRQIVVAGDADDARLRERLADTQGMVRRGFDHLPDFEARMDRWKGGAALAKGIASMEIDEIPIVRADSGDLRNLPEDSKLYINGHGRDGASLFQYLWEDRSRKKLRMEAMVEWFDQAGLPRDRHYDIRLQMCHSACPGPNDGPSMAKRFRDTMQEFGYGNVDVSGYLGDVAQTPLLHDDGVRHFVVQDVHGDGGFHRRSENRVTYKADGSVVDSRAAKASVRTPETERSDAPVPPPRKSRTKTVAL